MPVLGGTAMCQPGDISLLFLMGAKEMASVRLRMPVHFRVEVSGEGGLHRAQQISERLSSAVRD